MMDFNTSASVSERMQALLDQALETERDAATPRDYLGASRLGAACERQLQYEYAKAPVDPGRAFSGRLLRIFERGHRTEDMVIRWLRLAGFVLKTEDRDGQQFGFSAANGKLRGHCDGVLVDGLEGFSYPALWENKCVGVRSFTQIVKQGLAVARPVYAAQVATYQAYFNLHEHPAVFTAVNADSMEVHTEIVPFNAALAQKMSDRAVKVITATDAGELLPRSFIEPTHFECRMCPFQDRCWRSQS